MRAAFVSGGLVRFTAAFYLPLTSVSPWPAMLYMRLACAAILTSFYRLKPDTMQGELKAITQWGWRVSEDPV